MTVLFVIVTIVLFLTADWIYQRLKEGKTKSAITQLPLENISHTYSLRIPEGIFFTKSHTWLNLFPSGKVHLGIDDFLGNLLEKPEINLLRNSGDKIEKNDSLIAIKDGTHQLIVRSPIAGEILSANQDLIHNPSLLKNSLFSDGWAYGIKPNKFGDLKQFLLGTESRKWIIEEFSKLRDFLSSFGKEYGLSPATLQDGGFPMIGAMKLMNNDVWKKFEEEFLQLKNEGEE